MISCFHQTSYNVTTNIRNNLLSSKAAVESFINDFPFKSPITEDNEFIFFLCDEFSASVFLSHVFVD